MMSSPFSGREFGVLLHPSCLFGREDIGTFGREAYQLVDWVASTGARIWQILPLTLNGKDDSPYFSLSAFAGNPWLVDLENLLTAELLDSIVVNEFVGDAAVSFEHLSRTKLPQLMAAAHRLLSSPAHPWFAELAQFRLEQDWLEDTTHFFALRESLQNAPWWTWPEALRVRDAAAIAASKSLLSNQMALWAALFFFADRQWMKLKDYANGKGLKVLGDLPIYVSPDSADVWLNQSQFQLDEFSNPLAVSGCPPDYFSEVGQLWGNTLYDWTAMARDGFAWWVARLRRCIEQADIVRIDHFRALSAYWEIPADAVDARGGKWVAGPGQAFFDVLRREFPDLPFVAEDLGTLDDAVYKLRDDNGLFGMKILQFGFDGLPDNPHLPHRFPTASIAYTGTHDNEPLAGWWFGLDLDARKEVAAYYQFDVHADVGRVVWSLIEAAIASRADVAVVPIQDLLVLDGRARMNNPGTTTGNWAWRMPANGLSAELAESVKHLLQRYGR